MRNILFILLIPFIISAQDFSVGTWREHLPHENVTYVVPMGDKCYASTPYSMYYYDNADNSVNRLNTITGLSEIGISKIHPNDKNNTIVVGYNSGNIDLIKEDRTINISAIINSNIVGDKMIYGIFSKEDYTYLATGFGIVVVDVKKEEIKATYIIGANGSQIKVNDVVIGGGYIYAATENGIKRALESDPFLSDPSVWTAFLVPPSTSIDFQKLEYYSGLSNDRLIVIENGPSYNDDSVYIFENNTWNSPVELIDHDIYSFELSQENMIVCSNSGVTIYDHNFTSLDVLYTYNGSFYITPNQCVWDGEFYWVADKKKGLSRVKTNWDTDNFTIAGPYSNEAFHLTCNEEVLWVSSGRTYGTNWNNAFNWRGVFKFDQFNWSTYNMLTVPELSNTDTISDYVWVTVDPSDKDHVFASSFRGGLIELDGDEFLNRYTFYNSSLQTRIGHNGNNVNVAATCFDNNGYLWVANSFVNEPLSVKTPDNQWLSFSCGSLASEQLCTDLIVDEIYGYIWMAIKGVGLLVYDCNQTPLITQDDQYKLLTSSSGQGDLPSNIVNSIAEDRDGEIWIGTEQGPAVIYNPYDIFNGGDYDAQQILLELDGTVQLLLEHQNITEILVDGGNRKWFATSGGGLFLMSEDGTAMIESFNQENSPLFSNNVISLAMNKVTGELYIATEKGIMGYKGDATEPTSQFSDVYAYPNPVRPEYNGSIAIKGLTEDSEVKITDASGNLVFSTVSIGGQAKWNGKRLSGERVSTGIYYVFATSNDGSMRTKTKILFIK